MPRFTWDDMGDRLYELGDKHGVLYPSYDSKTKRFKGGVPWNGLTAVTESPSGAESNAMYADDIKYGEIRSNEEFGATIEAYTYPDEWAECDGSKALGDTGGMIIGQQTRKPFGFSYVTTVGNDELGMEYGYKLHLVYNATASPSEKSFATINDSPEAITFSWELTTTPVAIDTLVDENGKPYKPTSIITIDSTKFDPARLKALEDILYDADDAYLPTPYEVYTILFETAPVRVESITADITEFVDVEVGERKVVTITIDPADATNKTLTANYDSDDFDVSIDVNVVTITVLTAIPTGTGRDVVIESVDNPSAATTVTLIGK